jgi:drug/metabolite transporter (DMT)-like permease
MMLPPLFWSGNFVLGRAVAGTVPPVALAFWRWFFGALIVLPFAWRRLRGDLPALRRHWGIVLALSVLGIGAFNTLVYIGLADTTALNAVMMQSAMPVLIVLMSFALFRDAVTPLQGVGIAISLSGALTLIARGDLQVLGDLRFNSGDLWVAAAVLCYAAYTALLRRRPPVQGLSFLVVSFALGAMMLAPLYIRETLGGRPLEVNATSALAIAYVSVFPSILAYLCFNRSVMLIGANRTGLCIHLMPVFGSALAIAFLGEEPHLYHAAGIALIAAGLLLANRRKAP